MKGYKVFNEYWKCRGFLYKVGKEYTMDEDPVCCEIGFHFCTDIKNCFSYYDFDSRNKVAEVEAFGKIDEGDNKCCTNGIRIIRELSWNEVLNLVNTGKDCTGFCNTGDWNTGDRNTGNCNTGDWNTGNRNTGDWNTGDRNTGDCNTGDCNTGDWNTGDCNTGDWNTGNRNTGNRNTGNRNTGDWNFCNYSSGCFNTEQSTIRMFNEDSEMTLNEWWNCDARYLLNRIPKNVVEWICSENMTDQEKQEHPEHETTGGYLKVLDKSDSATLWWNGLSESDKDIIRSLPNFDFEIFCKCVGIKHE